MGVTVWRFFSSLAVMGGSVTRKPITWQCHRFLVALQAEGRDFGHILSLGSRKCFVAVTQDHLEFDTPARPSFLPALTSEKPLSMLSS